MSDDELFDQIRKLMHENMIQGRLDNGQQFHYTKPSPERYPYQFFWDTCFHVFIFSALGEYDMGKKHLYSLFAMQKEDGFVGHMIYWDRLRPGRVTDFFQSQPRFQNLYRSHMSALLQPPLAAQAVMRVYRASGDKDFLKEMLPKLKKYYLWLAHNRDFDDDGLLSIISPFESGMDWKPSYDIALGMPEQKANWRLFLKVVGVDLRNYLNDFKLKRIARKAYFLVKDVGFNTVYAQNLGALARICEELEDQDAQKFKQMGERVQASILEHMYEKEDAAFYDLYGKDNRKIRVLTPTIFYPVVMKGIPDEICKDVLQKHFFNEEEFGVQYPIPSVAKNSPSFNPTESVYIWRGPTWIVNNWFMHQFLLEKGYKEEAKQLITSIRKLIMKSGFREYYNPFTGEGFGAGDFTWAGLVVDMIQMQRSGD